MSERDKETHAQPDAGAHTVEADALSGTAWVQLPRSVYDELKERVEMLNHIALSAIALKVNIESGFPPTLHALNRDLALYQVRFGGVVEMAINPRLGLLDREGE